MYFIYCKNSNFNNHDCLFTYQEQAFAGSIPGNTHGSSINTGGTVLESQQSSPIDNPKNVHATRSHKHEIDKGSPVNNVKKVSTYTCNCNLVVFNISNNLLSRC